MLKHGRAGVPMEVMGLMLGEFVDDYTVRVIDVFAMPQSGTVRIATAKNYIRRRLIYRTSEFCCALLWPPFSSLLFSFSLYTFCSAVACRHAYC